MNIGVISDTHDNFDSTKRAVEIFKQRDIKTVLHAGDIIDMVILDLFCDFDLFLVQGNGDPDIPQINKKLQSLKKNECHKHYDIQILGKNILLTHGDNIPHFRSAVESGMYDYIIKGHTHFPEDYIRNNIRILNPGALSRASIYSIGILDIEKNNWEIIEL